MAKIRYSFLLSILLTIILNLNTTVKNLTYYKELIENCDFENCPEEFQFNGIPFWGYPEDYISDLFFRLDNIDLESNDKSIIESIFYANQLIKNRKNYPPNKIIYIIDKINYSLDGEILPDFNLPESGTCWTNVKPEDILDGVYNCSLTSNNSTIYIEKTEEDFPDPVITYYPEKTYKQYDEISLGLRIFPYFEQEEYVIEVGGKVYKLGQSTNGVFNILNNDDCFDKSGEYSVVIKIGGKVKSNMTLYIAEYNNKYFSTETSLGKATKYYSNVISNKSFEDQIEILQNVNRTTLSQFSTKIKNSLISKTDFVLQKFIDFKLDKQTSKKGLFGLNDLYGNSLNVKLANIELIYSVEHNEKLRFFAQYKNGNNNAVCEIDKLGRFVKENFTKSDFKTKFMNNLIDNIQTIVDSLIIPPTYAFYNDKKAYSVKPRNATSCKVHFTNNSSSDLATNGEIELSDDKIPKSIIAHYGDYSSKAISLVEIPSIINLTQDSNKLEWGFENSQNPNLEFINFIVSYHSFADTIINSSESSWMIPDSLSNNSEISIKVNYTIGNSDKIVSSKIISKNITVEAKAVDENGTDAENEAVTTTNEDSANTNEERKQRKLIFDGYNNGICFKWKGKQTDKENFTLHRVPNKENKYVTPSVYDRLDIFNNDCIITNDSLLMKNDSNLVDGTLYKYWLSDNENKGVSDTLEVFYYEFVKNKDNPEIVEKAKVVKDSILEISELDKIKSDSPFSPVANALNSFDFTDEPLPIKYIEDIPECDLGSLIQKYYGGELFSNIKNKKGWFNIDKRKRDNWIKYLSFTRLLNPDDITDTKITKGKLIKIFVPEQNLELQNNNIKKNAEEQSKANNESSGRNFNDEGVFLSNFFNPQKKINYINVATFFSGGAFISSRIFYQNYLETKSSTETTISKNRTIWSKNGAYTVLLFPLVNSIYYSYNKSTSNSWNKRISLMNSVLSLGSTIYFLSDNLKIGKENALYFSISLLPTYLYYMDEVNSWLKKEFDPLTKRLRGKI